MTAKFKARIGMKTVAKQGWSSELNAKTVAQLTALFAYNVDFVAGTAKGAPMDFSNNTNDGRIFVDKTNTVGCFLPNGTAVLQSVPTNRIRRTAKGYYNYASGTVRNLQNRTLSTAPWVNTGFTMTRDQPGADGAANTAWRLTATQVNATLTQPFTQVSTDMNVQWDIRRTIGAGPVAITVDGATWVDKTITADFQPENPAYISQAAVTNPVIGVRVANIGDEIVVDFPMLYARANGVLTPNLARVTTVAAGVLNSQSRPSIDAGDAGPGIGVLRGRYSMLFKTRTRRVGGGFLLTGATNTFVNVQPDGALRFTVGGQAADVPTGVWKTDGSLNKVAVCSRADGVLLVACNGIAGTPAVGAIPDALLDHADLSTNGAGQNSVHDWTEYWAASPDLVFTQAELNRLST